jgi:dTMP kinase
MWSSAPALASASPAQAMASAKFITFEGGEGSGKSTQAQLLADRLRGESIDVVLTREPGGSPFAEQVRSLILDPATAPHSPLCEALLFNAARADHLDAVIRPALAAGRWVICDRFADSTRVYQGVAGGLASRVLADLEAMVVAPTAPDLTFILDLPPDIGLARAANRRQTGTLRPTEADAFEKRDLAFHAGLRAGYAAIAAAEPGRCMLIDGARAPAAIAAHIWAHVEARFLREAS